jgi:hypothetical protein
MRVRFIIVIIIIIVIVAVVVFVHFERCVKSLHFLPAPREYVSNKRDFCR